MEWHVIARRRNGARAKRNQDASGCGDRYICIETLHGDSCIWRRYRDANIRKSDVAAAYPAHGGLRAGRIYRVRSLVPVAVQLARVRDDPNGVPVENWR